MSMKPWKERFEALKIKEIRIQNFGRFKEATYSFDEGFSVMYAKNEAGKSTLMAFVRACFYGLGHRGKDASRSRRTRYQPWEGTGPMGGSVLFEHAGKRLRLERRFGLSQRFDQSRLIDALYGSPIALEDPHAPGQELFSFSEEAFVNSALIQTPKAELGRDDGLEQQLNLLLSSGEEDSSYEEVLSLLKQRHQALKGGRDGGARGRIKEQMAAIDTRLSEQAVLAEALLEAQEKAAVLQTQLGLLENEETKQSIADEKADEERWQRYQRYQLLAREIRLAEEKQAQSERERSLPLLGLQEMLETQQKMQTEIRLAQMEEQFIQDKRREKDRLRAELWEGHRALEEARMAHAKLQESVPEMPKRIGNPGPFIVPFVFLALLALGAGFFLQGRFPVWSKVFWFLSAGLPVFILWVYWRVAQRQKDHGRRCEQIRRAHAQASLQAEERIQEASFALRFGKAQHERVLREQEENQAHLEKRWRTIQRIRQDLLRQVKPYVEQPPQSDEDLQERLQELMRQSMAHDQALQEESRVLKMRDALLEGEDPEAFCQAALEARERLKCSRDRAALDRAAQQEAYVEQSKALAVKDAEIKGMAAKLEGHEELLREREDAAERLERFEEEAEILELAMALVQESRSAFDQRSRPAIYERASVFLNEMTEGRYQRLRLDEVWESRLEAPEDGRLHEAAYFSAGTQDLLWIAVRLAVHQLLSEGRASLPLLFDDSLQGMDEKRQEAVFKLLARLATEGCQVLYFTASKSRAALAQKAGAVFQSL